MILALQMIFRTTAIDQISPKFQLLLLLLLLIQTGHYLTKKSKPEGHVVIVECPIFVKNYYFSTLKQNKEWCDVKLRRYDLAYILRLCRRVCHVKNR